MKPTRIITTLFALALIPLSAQAAVIIDFVTVGNPGNPADPLNSGFVPGIGSVADTYSIGKYEVTLNQYTEFLNAKAAADPLNLYNPEMATYEQIAGISRSGNSGSFTYSVIGDGLRPVTYVTFFDAVRFTNWLHNGQGSGSTENGAYTLLGGTATPSNAGTITRNGGAQFFLPSQNEWYKAAYHQPAAQGGDSDNYWLYPMRTNSVPFSDQPPGATPDNTRVGNFKQDDGSFNGYDDGFALSGSAQTFGNNVLTRVGAYTQSGSFYGTFDQGGNVWEWNDTRFPLSSPLERGVRGGSWDSPETDMQPSINGRADATTEGPGTGFRVAIPEPTLAGLLSVGAFLLISCRKRAY